MSKIHVNSEKEIRAVIKYLEDLVSGLQDGTIVPLDVDLKTEVGAITSTNPELYGLKTSGIKTVVVRYKSI